MAYLTAAVVLVGVLGILNLLLTVGVIRRLRVHTEELDALKAGRVPADTSLPPGTATPDFEAPDVDGVTVSRDGLLGSSYVLAFLSTDCRVCHDQLPDLVRYAGRLEGGRRRVLVVVAGDAGEAGEFVARLGPVARVVVEPLGGPISSSFSVNLLPSYMVVDRDGVVSASGLGVHDLPARFGAGAPAAGTQSATG